VEKLPHHWGKFLQNKNFRRKFLVPRNFLFFLVPRKNSIFVHSTKISERKFPDREIPLFRGARGVKRWRFRRRKSSSSLAVSVAF
jgi:hypothetical protein